ncbi:MAG TPA: ABC transporter permease [Candidatus Dormibacteraeota bacterium]|nr:ABC transporter permease [Candidatus Dormibacteraeota bacterium]
MSAPVRYLADTATIAGVEIRKVLRDPTELLTRAVQPVLWLLVFGQVLARARAIPTGTLSYLDFLAPGILAQSALFSAIFYGIAVIWERDLGVVHKLLVSPAPRGALVTGKAIAGGLRALVQALVVYLVAVGLRVHLRLDPLALLGVIFAIVIGSALFATFSLIIACLVRTRERFMGIGQVMTMPLFFASSAVYPVALMPGWLQAVAAANPLTYMVDLIRSLMIVGGPSAHGLGLDFAVLGGTLVVLLAIAARLYPRLAR